MYQQIIGAREEGQRLDKYLHKLLPEAGTSFLYKMMRKKNITLNDKKAQGMEKLMQGDLVKIYFAQETLEKFMGAGSAPAAVRGEDIPVIFETEHLLFVNKPAGVLSQRAKPEDYSVNEWILDYLRDHENLSEEQIRVFRPCVCNRLDRNTSGLVLCAKSVKGAQFLSDALKNRTMEKYYLAVVKGFVSEDRYLKGYLSKDMQANKVSVSPEPVGGSALAETSFEVVGRTPEHSLLKVRLITGKPHQIRAHLASIGHPVIGDDKYGDKKTNRIYRERCGINRQLLHAWQVRFPRENTSLGIEKDGVYTAGLPQIFKRVRGITYGNMEFERA